MKAMFITALSVVLSIHSYAADVSWDSFSIESSGSFTSIERRGWDMGGGHLAEVAALGITSSVGQDGTITLTGTLYPMYLSVCCLWVQMESGDLVSHETMWPRSDYFFATDESLRTNGIVSNAIELSEPGNVYLAVMQGLNDPNSPQYKYYGWIEVAVDEDGKISLLRDAYATDFSSLIVGDSPIPEPCSGMLMLVGAGVLALRRRERRSP